MNHPINFQICDFMTNIIIWESAYFWIYLLNNISLDKKLI